MKLDHQIITAVLLYYEGVTNAQQAADLFPLSDSEYQGQWAGRFAKGFAHAWGKMDYDSRRIYCKNAEKFAYRQPFAGSVASEEG